MSADIKAATECAVSHSKQDSGFGNLAAAFLEQQALLEAERTAREEAERLYRSQAAEYKLCRERLMIRSGDAEAAEADIARHVAIAQTESAARVEAEHNVKFWKADAIGLNTLLREKTERLAQIEAGFALMPHGTNYTAEQVVSVIRALQRTAAPQERLSGSTDKSRGQTHDNSTVPVVAAPIQETDSEGWSKDPNHWANRVAQEQTSPSVAPEDSPKGASGLAPAATDCCHTEKDHIWVHDKATFAAGLSQWAERYPEQVKK